MEVCGGGGNPLKFMFEKKRGEKNPRIDITESTTSLREPDLLDLENQTTGGRATQS